MSDLRKAAELALDALDIYREYNAENIGLADAAYEALRQALAQDALRKLAEIDHELGLYVDDVNMSQERVDETAKGEHEPVAWMGVDSYGNATKFRTNEFGGGTPLYTAPPKREWVGLTEDEAFHCFSDSSKKGIPIEEVIEAKLKEKNT